MCRRPVRALASPAAAVAAALALSGAPAAAAPAADEGARARAVGAARVAAPLPAPGAPLPRDPARLARRLAATTRALDAAVDRWRRHGRPAVGRPPRDVELLALHHQRIYRLLRADDRLAGATVARLPSGLAREARAIVRAGRGLRRITPAVAARRVRTRRPRPVGVLLRYYREAERRFGVPWQVLAAVNFVESAFGKIRSDSAAGARGPMQFLPRTWAAYGLGGNVHDDRDAILGAANYLRAAGAPRHLRRALWRYNPSARYVDAVLVYAGRMRADPRELYVFYSWQLFVRTERGDLRLTGPGR
ncbi:MAG: lytic transglycosylase domain-containing protein [Thermoleophilia bacterium]|nr:lytic transglycosylase domain-containing protein [Thermoleophilia bacterium]